MVIARGIGVAGMGKRNASLTVEGRSVKGEVKLEEWKVWVPGIKLGRVRGEEVQGEGG